MSIPTSTFIYINIGIIVFYIIMMIYGGKKGFLVQLVSFLGLLVAIILAWLFSPVLASFFDLWPHNWLITSSDVLDNAFYNQINQTAWFLLCVIVLKLLFLLLKPLTKLIQKVPIIKQLSCILGVVFGFVIATAWIMLLCVCLNMNFINNGNDVIEGTYLNPIKETVLTVFSDLREPFEQSTAISKFMTGVEDLTDSDRTYLKKWFVDNGFDDLPIEDFTQQGSPTPSPETSAKPSTSSEPSVEPTVSPSVSPLTTASSEATSN